MICFVCIINFRASCCVSCNYLFEIISCTSIKDHAYCFGLFRVNRIIERTYASHTPTFSFNIVKYLQFWVVPGFHSKTEDDEHMSLSRLA